MSRKSSSEFMSQTSSDVRVAALEWVADGPDAVTADVYRIERDGTWYRCFAAHAKGASELRNRPDYSPWANLNDAKAAAQADYEARAASGGAA